MDRIDPIPGDQIFDHRLFLAIGGKREIDISIRIDARPKLGLLDRRKRQIAAGRHVAGDIIGEIAQIDRVFATAIPDCQKDPVRSRAPLPHTIDRHLAGRG